MGSGWHSEGKHVWFGFIFFFSIFCSIFWPIVYNRAKVYKRKKIFKVVVAYIIDQCDQTARLTKSR